MEFKVEEKFPLKSKVLSNFYSNIIIKYVVVYQYKNTILILLIIPTASYSDLIVSYKLISFLSIKVIVLHRFGLTVGVDIINKIMSLIYENS